MECSLSCHYQQTQSKCLGAVLVIAGSVSVVCNVVMAMSDSSWAAAYLARAVLLAMMVSSARGLASVSVEFYWLTSQQHMTFVLVAPGTFRATFMYYTSIFIFIFIFICLNGVHYYVLFNVHQH